MNRTYACRHAECLYWWACLCIHQTLVIYTDSNKSTNTPTAKHDNSALLLPLFANSFQELTSFDFLCCRRVPASRQSSSISPTGALIERSRPNIRTPFTQIEGKRSWLSLQLSGGESVRLCSNFSRLRRFLRILAMFLSPMSARFRSEQKPPSDDIVWSQMIFVKPSGWAALALNDTGNRVSSEWEAERESFVMHR